MRTCGRSTPRPDSDGRTLVHGEGEFLASQTGCAEIDGRHHLVHAENVERSPQIVGERDQAEFGAHFFQAAHQERALIYP